MVEAVAGWLVCPIIKIVMDKAKCCASDRIKWLSDGVPKTLQRLENSLEQLRAVAGFVQQRRGSLDRIGELRAWLQQLIDAVYEARDVLDDFDDSVPQPESPVVRVSRRIFGADERVNRLKDVVEKLEAVHRTSTMLMQAAGLGSGSDSGDLSGHHQPQGRATGSVRHHEHVVLGRDRELQDMVSWLVGASDGDAKLVSVAAITGHGGMGKTTLAQLLFEDQKVISTFELKIWIQPAATDNEFVLTRQLLQSANVDVPHGMMNFNWLQMKLQEEVSSRRFLLVIDDVWNWNREDREGRAFQEMWSKVLAPISRGKTTGSKIVITTRQKMSADLLHASKEVWLHDLPPDAIWSLFKRCAFGEEDIDKQPQILQDIGRKIAEKLKGSGSPMAVKAVGQMLEGSRRDTHWKKVLDMDSFDNVSKTLELCYHNLPEHLQPCFAICSLFPKNWRFKRDKLVKIWMALDFIQADGGKIQLEDAGSDYFDQLVDRSFFHRQKVGRGRYYYIHDLMHDMAEKVSRFDCVRVEDAKKEIPKTIRHLSVSSDTVAQLKNLCWLKRLHTLLILKNPSSPLDQLPGDLLTELKGLRVLGLEGCNIVCLSEKIGNLKYLRYLALCKSITRLPQAVTKLYRLQTLSSPKGSGLEVPEDIINLKRLRHLDMDTSKITGIGKLVHLQGSIKFPVKNEKGHTLADLDGMSGLRKELHIMNLDVVMDQQAACQAGLNKKENVKILELEWNSTGKTVPSVEAEVLDGLEPNQYVKKLLIRRYHGDRSPDWLNTGLKASKFYFKYLHLINCRKWEVLPPLGQLPSLKALHLKEMCSVKKISGDFYGTNSIAFPSLEELEFDDMPQWVEWVQEEKNIDMLPKLRKLKLLNCPELIKVPHLPLSVRKVSVKNTGFVSQLKLSSSSSSKACKFALDTCSATVLTDGLLHQQQVEAIAILRLRNCQDVNFQELQALTSLKRLQISHSSINDEQLGSCLRGLQALTSLEISNCNNIKHLPQMESPDCLTKIHELHIQQCSEFSSLRSLPSFVALESVLIENCSKITMESFSTNFNINSSLRKLSIINCSELESLPSGFPSSLQVLHLIGCKPTLMDQLQLKDGLEWDKIKDFTVMLTVCI
ncbi:putative disease resistance RPP13-like protein 1 [Dichanthelium oligosanthes]|uniref:Putative disease resistance RPP13-like protein 1 n=1 Tax=Dichanthelium oligosanthes TaxID=888268 RepID=A0A1E5UIK7_9POAL|nr:putative disease resistance RPP13-like protein 1 [Dichanthelium oligosanthes]